MDHLTLLHLCPPGTLGRNGSAHSADSRRVPGFRRRADGTRSTYRESWLLRLWWPSSARLVDLAGSACNALNRNQPLSCKTRVASAVTALCGAKICSLPPFLQVPTASKY